MLLMISQPVVTDCSEVLLSPTSRRVRTLIAILTLACAGGANRVNAADWAYWIDPAGGNFTSDSRWDLGVTPGPSEGAIFNLGQPSVAPYSVTLGQNWMTESLVVYDDSVFLNLGGKTLRTMNSFRTSVYVGVFQNDVGYLGIAHGTLTGNGMTVGGPWTGSVGRVEISGADARLELTESAYGELVVGGGGEGHLVASKSSSVIVGGGGVYVGGDPGAGDKGTGTIELTSGATLQTTYYVYLGVYEGTGHLKVEGGGTISSYYGFIGSYGDPTGDIVSTARITGAGSSWDADSIFVGSNGVSTNSSGLLAIEGEGAVSATVFIDVTGTLAGDGGTIAGNTLNQGFIAPGGFDGAGVGELEITGWLDATNASSHLRFDLADAASFDRLRVNGQAYLGGVIDVDLLDGFMPSLGNSFALLSSASIHNYGYTFDFSDALLGPGLGWDTSTFGTDGTLRVTAVPEPSTWLLAVCGALAAQFFWRTRLR